VHQGTAIPFHLVTLSQRFAFTRQGQQAGVGFGGGSGLLGHAASIDGELCRFNQVDETPALQGREMRMPGPGPREDPSAARPKPTLALAAAFRVGVIAAPLRIAARHRP
jgi:hypothetical protein